MAVATAVIAQQKPVPPTPPAKAAVPPNTTAPASDGGVQTCVACHGERGEGNPQGGFPRIAGQSAGYLLHQLDSYADGSRRNPVMEPIAKALSREARKAVAAHYAALAPGAGMAAPGAGTAAPRAGTAAQQADAAASDTAPANERGAEIALRGDDRRQVQACANCHGPDGIGEPPAIPYLAGLDAKYLVSALDAFRNGSRRNDAGQQMRTVVRALSQEDASAVARYFASLPPPARPAPEDVVRAPSGPGPTAGAATTTSRPTGTSAGAPSGTVGTEQGSPTTGGTQGPGADQPAGKGR